MPIKSFEQVRQEIIQTAEESRSGLNLQDYEVLDASYVRPLANEEYKVSIIQEFLRRMLSFDGMRSLVNDTEFQTLLAFAYGVSQLEALSIIDFTIEKFAASFGVSRRAAVKASGFVRFIDPANVPVVVGVGKQVGTSSAPQKLFVTTSSADSVLPVFDPVEQHYYVELPVEAVTAGTVGNVAANIVNTVVDSDISVPFVKNTTPISGGLDRQPILEVIDAFEQVFRGITLNTVAGYENFVLGQANVISVYGADENDALFTREFIGGAIDLWVLSNAREFLGADTLEWQEILDVADVVTTTDVLALTNIDTANRKLEKSDFPSGTDFTDYFDVGMKVTITGCSDATINTSFVIETVNAADLIVSDPLAILTGAAADPTVPGNLAFQYIEYSFSRQPVSAISSVREVEATPLSPVALPKLGYELITDTESLSRSSRGNDRVRMRIDTFDPADTIQLLYRQNSVIQTLQDLLESASYNVVGSDILIRAAIPRTTVITLSPVYVDSSDKASVDTVIQDTVSVFFNGGTNSNGVEFSNRGIGGATFQITDLITEILNIDGIDALNTLNSFNSQRVGISVDGNIYSSDFTLSGLNVSTSPSIEITLANNEFFNLTLVTII